MNDGPPVTPEREGAAMDGVTITMVDVQGQLEREIADKRMARKDVALTYAFGIRDCPDEVDWPKINRLIMDRWSLNALKFIKESAWRRVRS